MNQKKNKLGIGSILGIVFIVLGIYYLASSGFFRQVANTPPPKTEKSNNLVFDTQTNENTTSEQTIAQKGTTEDQQIENNNTQTTSEGNATIDLDRFDMEVTLKKLYDEYSSNSIRANQIYLNKRLKITAPIYKFETVENGLVPILIGLAKEDENTKSKWNKITLKQKNVNCLASFDFEIGDDTGILDYNVGDNITIIGTLTSTGKVTLFFRSCKIVNN